MIAMTMCFFSTPKIPKAPPGSFPVDRQPIRLPDGGSTDFRADDIARRRRALAATAFTGALGLGAPTTSSTYLGG